MAKKNVIDMGKTGYNKEDWEALHWCIRNEIRIAPKAKNSSSWYIDITNKGPTYTSPIAYEKTEIWEKIFEYCKYYYEKNKHTK
jgi:hypothetical protein